MLAKCRGVMRYEALGLILVIVAGCVNERPVLYPSELVRRVGAPAAEQEIDFCMNRAEEYIDKAKRGEVIFEENVTGSRGLAGGPAFEAKFKQDPTPIYRSLVNQCLREKGFEPLTWK
jgi:hypothetical protein